MRTRIREFRKARDMTLKDLASRIGTTPQTVQRLETGSMAVSTAWLDRIAAAFGVEPADLIGRGGSRQIPMIGHIGPQGYLNAATLEPGELFHFDIPADDPVAARFDVDIHGFSAGSILIANRFREPDMINAHGLDCIVALRSGTVLFRWVIRGQSGTWTLVPHDRRSDVQYDQDVAWLARVVMTIAYH